jgi:glycosyltransferase involved in cell wall biosynthesis
MTLDLFISVILPVHNQANHIGSIVEEHTKIFESITIPYEIILVVNGCRDNSLEICHSLAEKYSSICVKYSKKKGWGMAVRIGLSEAKGNLLCFTNSARTSSQDLMLLLLYAIANPNVVIKANRKSRENYLRRMGSLLYNLECRMLFDLSYWDINGTPKVFPRKFEKLVALTRDDDLIDLEFNVICRREGYPVLEVPIFSSRRPGEKSTTNCRSALKMYWGAYQLWRTMLKDSI